MKTKKIVSLILAIIMVVGLLPLSALAGGARELLDTVTVGKYTDMKSIPEKSYEYTVMGSDGSMKNVVALGTNAGTGNRIEQITKAGVYYVRVHNYDTTGSEFLLVGEAGSKNFAMGKTGKLSTEVQVVNDPDLGEIIRGDYYDSQWKIETDSNGSDTVYRRIINNDNDWLYIAEGGTGLALDNPYTLELRRYANNTFKIFKWSNGSWFNENYALYYIDSNGNVSVKNNFIDDGKPWDERVAPGTSFKWYQRRGNPNDEFVIHATDMEAVLAEANKREFSINYEGNSWNNFENAKRDAQSIYNSVNNTVYTDVNKANEDLRRLDTAQIALKNAINALELAITEGEYVIPEITWHRTVEDNDHIYKNVQTIDSLNYSVIWKWNDVKNLTATDSNVWNYNDNGMKAATWNHMGEGWPKASIRRLSGTFVWPYGYDFNDKAELLSINDNPNNIRSGNNELTELSKDNSKYVDIYNHIKKHAQAFNGRYDDARVFAVNDNMVVLVSKADEQPANWTDADAQERMVLYTGTDGKGIWSERKDELKHDSARKAPATFLGKSLAPSYYKSMPNNEDIHDKVHPGVEATPEHLRTYIEPWSSENSPNDLTTLTKFSDGWYSLVNTTNVMSNLKNIYGNQDFGGELMRIEIFAFDNGGTGGMDEPIIKIAKPDSTDIPVYVNYYLNDIKSEKLGTTRFFAVEGSVQNLGYGTQVNQLNHFKALAATKVPSNNNIEDGVQLNPDYEVVKGANNVINVVYKSNAPLPQYLVYDFASNNDFIFHDKSVDEIQSVELVGEGIEGAKVVNVSGHDIKINYTPKNSIGEVATGIIKITRKGSGVVNEYSLGFVPASNVLYEENFFTIEKGVKSPWLADGKAAAFTVTDNEGTVFGYTDGYSSSIGSNGAYTATLTETGAHRFTDYAHMEFRGQGFDLIGACGPNTGTLMVSVRVKNSNTAIKNFIVNTEVNDTTFGNMIHQVPLVHCLGLEPNTYDVVVRGANINYNKPARRMAYSARNSAINSELYRALLKMGMTEDEIANAEYINMNDVLGARTFALKNAAPKAAGTKTVSIEGFRVYRSSANKVYPVDEQNIKYTNIMDAKSGTFAAYVAGQGNGTYEISQYEKMGGPENELYLPGHTAVAIAVEDANIVKTQVSLRAVTGSTTASITDAADKPINHNTELYYNADVKGGVIVIANRGDNLLAVGNVKCAIKSLSESQQAQALKMVARMMAAPTVGKFQPARFDVQLNVIKTLFNQYATLKVKTSDDVAYITVNGVRVDSNNVNLHKWGVHDYMRFTLRKTFKKNDAILFEVVAYDKDGNATKPVIKK